MRRGSIKALALLSAVLSCPASAQILIIPGEDITASCPPPVASAADASHNAAKASLPKFWKYYSEAWVKSGRFKVLLQFRRSNGTYTELWTQVDSVMGATASGTLIHSDTKDARYRKGNNITFQVTSPVDWGVKSLMNDSWYGMYHLRASLPRCDAVNRNKMLQYFLTPKDVW
jgi:hypothetical protein